MKKSRKEILKINPAFTKFILELQLSHMPQPYEEGGRVDGVSFNLKGDNEGVTILTKELADKLNREQNENFERNRDENPFANSEGLKFLESQLIISSKKNTTEYLKDIANGLERIRIELGETDLMVLGIDNTPWLYQENEYLPVKNALNYLKQRIDKKFDGGFLLNKEDILEFVPHLFWLTRCNASLPYFYISFPKSLTIISICKYGVLHFDFYNQSEKVKILNILSDMNFQKIDNCEDPVEFDRFDGRQIKTSS